jgi:hypothetical protein
MRRGSLIVACLALAQASMLAQDGPASRLGSFGPGFGVRGLEVVGFGALGPGEPVLGVPFRAEATTETSLVLADGNRIERQSTSTIARDGRGRVRRESPLPSLGPLGPAPEVTIVTIADPSQRLLYFLDLERKSARRVELPPRTATGPDGVGPPWPGRSGRGPQVRTEPMGTKLVAGLMAEGTRTTMTIPAGALGNVNAIEVVTVRWFSPDLRIVLSSHRTDPLSGDVVFTVVNLVRGEPPADLFEVPADFTMTQEGPGRWPAPR